MPFTAKPMKKRGTKCESKPKVLEGPIKRFDTEIIMKHSIINILLGALLMTNPIIDEITT